MDRYIPTITNTMNSVLSTLCWANVVVGVAILGVPALLHAQVHSWRWAPSGLGANPQAAYGFAMA